MGGVCETQLARVTAFSSHLWMEGHRLSYFCCKRWTPCLSRSCIMLLLMSILISSTVVGGLQVIGGNITVVQGETTVLPCKLIDSTEHLTQISWQRMTKGNPQNDNFFIVLDKTGPQFVNGRDERFKFVGNFNEKHASMQLSNATLMDEGIYTCIFTLFPIGNRMTEIPLNLLVPPVTSLKGHHPTLGDNEVVLATCTAAGSKPPATVRWLTGTLAENVRPTFNSSMHDNDTTTTVSSLFGVPTREINSRSVQCVVTSAASSKEETLSITIQVLFPPMEVNISKKSEDLFECVADANPYANFTWTRISQSIPQSAVRVKGPTLQFLGITSDLNGLYQCSASNPYGKSHGHLYMHVNSGNCVACWVFFVILLFALVFGVVAAWYLYKAGRLQWNENDMHGERQRVPTTNSTPERAAIEVEPLGDTGGGSASVTSM